MTTCNQDDHATGDVKHPPGSELTVAVVVPCFHEQETIAHTARTLCTLLQHFAADALVSPQSYILFVDDGSEDNTWALIESLFHEYEPVKGLKLSRNFGHQTALLAGLDFVTDACDVAISIDADLQQDPMAMKSFISAYHQGSDIVLGIRNNRETDSWLKRTTATGFYELMRLMGVDIVPNHADYRLLSKRALQALRRFEEPNIFLRATCLQLGFRVSTVYFDVSLRQFGETKYTLKKMLRLALEGITSHSIVPLRIVAFIGFIIFLFSLSMGCYVLWQALVVGGTVPGWASTTLPIYFIGGVQLLCMGIIGEYIGQLYQHVKQRPRWISERVLA
jgi:glycosyltransferase involved in cell wall biosynthesis